MDFIRRRQPQQHRQRRVSSASLIFDPSSSTPRRPQSASTRSRYFKTGLRSSCSHPGSAPFQRSVSHSKLDRARRERVGSYTARNRNRPGRRTSQESVYGDKYKSRPSQIDSSRSSRSSSRSSSRNKKNPNTQYSSSPRQAPDFVAYNPNVLVQAPAFRPKGAWTTKRPPPVKLDTTPGWMSIQAMQPRCGCEEEAWALAPKAVQKVSSTRKALGLDDTAAHVSVGLALGRTLGLSVRRTGESIDEHVVCWGNKVNGVVRHQCCPSVPAGGGGPSAERLALQECYLDQ